MERLTQRIKLAEQALKALDEALEMPVTKIVRDASIQRFEFSFEAVWKLSQLYLRQKEGVEVGSPKGVFRACFETGILNETQTNLALRMADDRNLTVHTYNEQLAQQIFSHLPNYSELLRNLVKIISSKNVKE